MNAKQKKEKVLEVFDEDLEFAYKSELRAGEIDLDYNSWAAQYDANALLGIIGYGDDTLEERLAEQDTVDYDDRGEWE